MPAGGGVGEGELPPESRQTEETIKNMGFGRLLYQPSSTAFVDMGFNSRYIYAPSNLE